MQQVLPELFRSYQMGDGIHRFFTMPNRQDPQQTVVVLTDTKQTLRNDLMVQKNRHNIRVNEIANEPLNDRSVEQLKDYFAGLLPKAVPPEAEKL